MDLYYSPYACSFASHVLVREAQLDVRLVPVSLQRKQLADGSDYHAVAPKGQVPALRLDDGTLLTEGVAVLQMLADLAPQHGWLPARGSLACYQAMEWLGFVATELHKQCLYPIFTQSAPEASRQWALALLPQKLALAARRLEQQPYLGGAAFGIADAYFAWVLLLCERLGIDLGEGPLAPVGDYWQRIRQRPAVAQCMADEGATYLQYR
jgi:glutathione S-transferase